MKVIVKITRIEDDYYNNGKHYTRTIKEIHLMETNKMKRDEKYESMTIEVNTPDGVLYYTICESSYIPNKISKVISTFGKAGTSLAAWAFAVDLLVNMLLENGVDINDIITQLSQISGEKPIKKLDTGEKVGSGPEGLVVAVLEYKRQKYREHHLRLLQAGDQF